MTEPAATARLFVAIPVPRDVARSLARLAPSPAESIRRIAPVDMHVTLHFIGTAAIETCAGALASVRSEPFRIRLGAPGHIRMRGGKRVLWIDVEVSDALLALHQATGAALEAIGFTPEERDYRPHVTLARLGPTAPRRLVGQFERTRLPDKGDRFECDRFGLFQSETAPEGARYEALRWYPLGP